MLGIEIRPLDEGNKVKVPLNKTSIGRGPFLQVADKKVSRNHATVEVNSKGQMVLTPIHTNPCFYKTGGKGEKTILAKDKPKVLLHRDVFGLLPDKLYFEVVYLDQVEKEKKMKEEETGSETDATDEAGDDDDDEDLPKKKDKKYRDMAMPLEKTRKLPKWMVGASKRVVIGASNKTPTKTEKPKVATNAKKAKAPPRATPKAAPKRSRRRVSDDDDDDDYEDEVKTPARTPRAASQKKPKYDDDYVGSGEDLDLSDSADDSEDKNEGDSDFVADDIDDSGSDWAASQSSARKRSTRSTPSRKGRGRGRGRPRRSTSKRKGYSDSDDDDFLDDSEDDSEGYVPRPSKRRAPPRRRKQTESEDSEVSEEEFKPKRKSKRKKYDSESEEEEVKPKKRGRRKKDSESEEEEVKPKKRGRRKKDSESEEEVKPKKRGGRKMDSESEEEVKPKKKGGRKQDSESEEEVKPKKKGKVKQDSDGSDVEEPPKKKRRRPCQFGKKCYRKNPTHFTGFCHPGDETYDEFQAEAEAKADEMLITGPKRKPILREKDKRSVLRHASDDDGEPNTYDYKDSFLDDEKVSEDEASSAVDSVESDSDFDPEEDLRTLKKEAKGFVKNKKMQRPTRSK